MVQLGTLGQGTAQFAPYDPLAPPKRASPLRQILLISLALHLIALFWFWDAIVGAVFEKDETVIVRMVEEKQPEPPKPRRKVIAQTRIDTRVERRREIRREIKEVQPVERLDQFKMQTLDPLRLTEAPRQVEQRDLTVARSSVFADRVAPIQPMQVRTHVPTVRQIHVGGAPSAGPRKQRASGPRVDPKAIERAAPSTAKGVVSSVTVQGSAEGARIAALRSGNSDLFRRGDDGGSIGASEKNCMKDPKCRAYLEMIRDRVYARWSIPEDIPAGRVTLSFRIDRGGSAHDIRQKRTDDPNLGTTCVQAFRHASPFPPPPPEISYLIDKGIAATFTYGD